MAGRLGLSRLRIEQAVARGGTSSTGSGSPPSITRLGSTPTAGLRSAAEGAWPWRHPGPAQAAEPRGESGCEGASSLTLPREMTCPTAGCSPRSEGEWVRANSGWESPASCSILVRQLFQGLVGLGIHRTYAELPLETVKFGRAALVPRGTWAPTCHACGERQQQRWGGWRQICRGGLSNGSTVRSCG
jgi:hypothetical protein